VQFVLSGVWHPHLPHPAPPRPTPLGSLPLPLPLPLLLLSTAGTDSCPMHTPLLASHLKSLLAEGQTMQPWQRWPLIRQEHCQWWSCHHHRNATNQLCYYSPQAFCAHPTATAVDKSRTIIFATVLPSEPASLRRLQSTHNWTPTLTLARIGTVTVHNERLMYRLV
jgi:hypothetical protein